MVKVLLYGASLTRQIIEPFAVQIKKACDDIQFYSAGFFLSKGLPVIEEHPSFEMEKCYSYSFQSKAEVRSFEKLGPNQEFARKVERRLARIGASKRFRKLAPEIDLLHCQGLFDPAHALKILNNCSNIPVVVSCWGSDILRTHDLAIISKQQKLLIRADVITVSSPEFREIVLAKFGQFLRPKIVLTQFSANLEGILASDRTKSGQSFRASHGIPEGEVTVGIAHNGHEANRHLDLIQSLAALDLETCKRLHLVVPMTYGADEIYLEKVKGSLEISGMKYTLLTSFLTEEEVVSMRNGIDIFIYAPVSDAYSSSVSQALAAGSECILGSWLPYKSRVTAGFKYTEIDSAGEAGQALEKVLREYLRDPERATLNRKVSQSFFDPVHLGLQWRGAYQKALDAKLSKN